MRPAPPPQRHGDPRSIEPHGTAFDQVACGLLIGVLRLLANSVVALALFGGQKREVITIDQYGNTITRTENPQKTLQIVLGALLALWLLLAVIGSCSAATHHDSNSGGSSMSEMQAVSH